MINRFMRKWIPSVFVLRQILRLLLENRDSYLHTTGLIHTFKVGKPETPRGEPLPWMNFSVIAFLKDRLNRNLTLFEFGSGYSTYFFANLVKKVTSVEYNRKWHETISFKLPENASLIFKEKDYDGQYCRTVLETKQQFDVIVIDGRDRINCAKRACHALSNQGVLLFDDTDREIYRPALEYLVSQGFRRIDFKSMKPASIKASTATLFYKANNCLGI